MCDDHLQVPFGLHTLEVDPPIIRFKDKLVFRKCSLTQFILLPFQVVAHPVCTLNQQGGDGQLVLFDDFPFSSPIPILLTLASRKSCGCGFTFAKDRGGAAGAEDCPPTSSSNPSVLKQGFWKMQFERGGG